MLIPALLAAAAFTQPPHVFILAGQSNMVGFGQPVPAEVANARIRVSTSTGSVVARDPLFPYDPSLGDAMPGVGPGLTFAQNILPRIKGTIILVPCAASGTRIAQWQPRQPLFTRCVAMARAALHGGTLAGILFAQGESDAGSDPPTVTTWPAAFTSFVAGMRAAFGRTVPVVFSQVPTPPETWPEWMRASYTQMQTLQAGTRLYRVTSISVADIPYGVDAASANHFSPSAYVEIGRRYAAAWRRLVSR